MKNKVLVFDTGAGGKYVYEKIKERFPDLETDFVADSKGIPYGNKSDSRIIESALKSLRPIVDDFSHIVIACHTLTQIGIEGLRKEFPDKIFVGFDPGLKVSKDKGYKDICMLATKATKNSDKYKKLKEDLGLDTVFEPNCDDWALRIEQNKFDVNEAIEVCKSSNFECIILGCTHYFWLEDKLKASIGNRVEVINPTNAVINQLERLLTASAN